MPRNTEPHAISFEIDLPFCEETITVMVHGVYTPGSVQGGEYEYPRFEWHKITKFALGRGEIDLTDIIPGDCEAFIADAALDEYERGAYGERDANVASAR